MTKNTKEWLIVLSSAFGLILLLEVIIWATAGGGGLIFMLLLGGTIGIPFGFGDAPIYNSGHFKLFYSLALIFALSIVGVGAYYNKKLWGKIMVLVGLLLWCFSGLIAFGITF